MTLNFGPVPLKPGEGSASGGAMALAALIILGYLWVKHLNGDLHEKGYGVVYVYSMTAFLLLFFIAGVWQGLH